ncbi:hypothetical protein I6G82_02610 [Lysinibacillus macroides]|uniref:Uncharacterized protein n=1 Tax=Lysinibacillus macroides TaxID=33935 RepID=A0A0N0CV86_9BACI|nr:hypothetical protein [Lysinibacillus macroides]KOY81295.1 hypothetical protein ADM90_19360 [Lysinibacillus macroides]QPR68543.1 hypothetical protein I6G82_02610 [Lysinibacillus macroides]
MDIFYNPGEKIKVTFTDDQTLIGIVDHWTSANDSDGDIQELTIKPIDGELKDQLVNFNENEVSTIEIIK